MVRYCPRVIVFQMLYQIELEGLLFMIVPPIFQVANNGKSQPSMITQWIHNTFYNIKHKKRKK